MIKYLLDTDTVSFLMKKKHPYHNTLFEKIRNHIESSIAISVITLSEIQHGLEKTTDLNKKDLIQRALDKILESFIVLEFNDDAAREYGKIRACLQALGQEIGIMDSMIAAHALSQGLTLVTNNLKHFQRIKSLTLENWTC
ncbi:MAG: type II toxin-antitoxin system VapC family toxin [Gammaproteobacteria bacterium]